MSKIHFTVRYFIRGKMNRIRKVEKIKGTHLRYLCWEASHCSFALLVDGEALSMGLAASPVSSFFSALHPAVLSNGIVRSIPPCFRALSTVNTSAALLSASERCPPIVPDLFLRASERCPPSVPDLFLHGAVHHQCPGCVPPCLRALSTASARYVPPCLRAPSTTSARCVPPCLRAPSTVNASLRASE